MNVSTVKRKIQALGHAIGIRFAPDNHVIPVLRLGRFNRVEGPGYFRLIPLLEQSLLPVNTGLRVGNFIFREVLSCDNIPFTFHLVVLFTFDPTRPSEKVVAQLVRASEDVLRSIVQDYASQGLRRLASAFDAENLCGKSAMSSIERDLVRFLKAQLHILGLAPLRNGGVLIKEVVSPDRFKRAMLNVKRHEAILRMLSRYGDSHLIERAALAQFFTGLEEREGNLTLLSPLDTVYPLYSLSVDKVSRGDAQ